METCFGASEQEQNAWTWCAISANRGSSVASMIGFERCNYDWPKNELMDWTWLMSSANEPQFPSSYKRIKTVTGLARKLPLQLSPSIYSCWSSIDHVLVWLGGAFLWSYWCLILKRSYSLNKKQQGENWFQRTDSIKSEHSKVGSESRYSGSRIHQPSVVEPPFAAPSIPTSSLLLLLY